MSRPRLLLSEHLDRFQMLRSRQCFQAALEKAAAQQFSRMRRHGGHGEMKIAGLRHLVTSHHQSMGAADFQCGRTHSLLLGIACKAIPLTHCRAQGYINNISGRRSRRTLLGGCPGVSLCALARSRPRLGSDSAQTFQHHLGFPMVCGRVIERKKDSVVD